MAAAVTVQQSPPIIGQPTGEHRAMIGLYDNGLTGSRTVEAPPARAMT